MGGTLSMRARPAGPQTKVEVTIRIFTALYLGKVHWVGVSLPPKSLFCIGTAEEQQERIWVQGQIVFWWGVSVGIFRGVVLGSTVDNLSEDEDSDFASAASEYGSEVFVLGR